MAIERYPELSAIFPSFEQYVLIITAIGVPLLILVGYLHYKRTLAYRSETDVIIESNPYQVRNVVNNTINVESDLMGMTRNLMRDCIEDNNYTDHAASSCGVW